MKFIFACLLGCIFCVFTSAFGDGQKLYQRGTEDEYERDLMKRGLQAEVRHRHRHNTSDHKHAWMKYEEVDGLKNEEVIMVVTSTTAKGETLLRERIIASARTWMRMFANVLVVIEDNFPIRFAMRNCLLMDHELFTAFKCHNEPIYLLSRNCTNEYYGAAGPCCKVDDALNWLINIRRDIFDKIKYLLHCDDDMYWRPMQTLRWLATVEKSGISQYPLIANLQFGDDGNKGVFMIKGCDEVHTTGWYQPLMMNRALLQKMAIGVANYGIEDTCRNFDVTHDVGVGVFAWMFAPYHIQLPNTNVNMHHKGVSVFRPDDMAMHYVKHADTERCDGDANNGWPKEDRYKQDLVIGCGDIQHSIAKHDKEARADMYDAMKYYQEKGINVTLGVPGKNEYVETYVVVDASGKVVHVLKQSKDHADDNFFEEDTAAPGTYKSLKNSVTLVSGETYEPKVSEKIEKRVIPRLLRLVGYSATNHSSTYNIEKEWKEFTLNDCNPPGRKDK